MFEDDGRQSDFAPAGIVLAQGSVAEQTSAIWLAYRGRALPLSGWSDRWFCARAASITDLVQNWFGYRDELRQLIDQPQTAEMILACGIPADSLRLVSPVRPQQLFCTIGNYRGQIIEATIDDNDPSDADRVRDTVAAALEQRRRDGAPYICMTSIGRVSCPSGELALDPGIDSLDWEAEIGVVIGFSGSRLSSREAGAMIAGYCVVNDLTIRSRIIRPDLPVLGSDWLQCKGLSGSLPVGPWFVPVWQVPDPAALRVQLRLNGTLMQDDTAADMVFTISEQLSYLSQHTMLRAGDLLCTGSPAGFGIHFGRFLRAGDSISASVTGLGRQTTTFTDPTISPHLNQTSPAMISTKEYRI